MKDWVGLGDWLRNETVYLPERQSPIPVLTGLDVEQLRWSRPTRYRYTSVYVCVCVLCTMQSWFLTLYKATLCVRCVYVCVLCTMQSWFLTLNKATLHTSVIRASRTRTRNSTWNSPSNRKQLTVGRRLMPYHQLHSSRNTLPFNGDFLYRQFWPTSRQNISRLLELSPTYCYWQRHA